MAIETFYNERELEDIGLKQFGRNVKISRKSSIYAPEKVVIGNNVRIDDFCILSGNINLGSCIHIGAYSALYGQTGITMEDYSGVSARVLVYSISDDYSGEFMTNPMIPMDLKQEIEGPIQMDKHSIIGAGSIVLPKVHVGEGGAVGAMSLVNKSIEPWTVNVGIPSRKIKERSKNILNLERKYLEGVREGRYV